MPDLTRIGWRAGVAVVGLLLCAVSLSSPARSSDSDDGGNAQTSGLPPSRSSRSRTVKPTAASSELSLADLQRKLDQVVATQEEILKKLDQMMEELKIVKIRATLHT